MSRSPRLRRRRRALVALLLAAPVVAAAPAAGAAHTAAPDTAAGTTAAEDTAGPGRRPNIVLIVTDDQAMESVAKMPYVSSRRDWIRFSRAYVENSMCCPARATLLTGQYDTHTGVTNNGRTGAFDQTQTLPVWLKGAGYRTGLVGKYLNNYPEAFGTSRPFVPPGWTTWQAAYGNVTKSPAGVKDSLYNQYGYNISDGGRKVAYGTGPEDYQVDVLRRKAEQFIAGDRSKPFFLYFAPTATHGPWVASPRRTGLFDTAPLPWKASTNEPDVSDKPRHVRQLPPRDLQEEGRDRRRSWAAAVSVDDAVRALDDQLRRTGVYDDTVVIFMTDNGYAFGEHRFSGKRCEYAECARTPLLVRYPGKGGRTVGGLVSNVDIASTVAQLAGTTPRIPQDGRSLVPLLQGRDVPWRDAVLTHWPGDAVRLEDDPGHVPHFWGLRTPGYAYVEIVTTGERELYDLRRDPNELRNVAGTPLYARVQAGLRDRLAAMRADAVRGGTTSTAPTTSLLVSHEEDSLADD